MRVKPFAAFRRLTKEARSGEGNHLPGAERNLKMAFRKVDPRPQASYDFW